MVFILVLYTLTNSQCGNLNSNKADTDQKGYARQLDKEEQKSGLKVKYSLPRPFRKDVGNIKDLPLEKRVTQYIMLSKKKSKFPKILNYSFKKVITELILQEDFEGLIEIEKKIQEKYTIKKNIVYNLTHKLGSKYLYNTKKIHQMLKQWAEMYPHNVYLIQFRANSDELLLKVLHGDKYPVNDRIQSIALLNRKYGKIMIPQLKKYEYSKREFYKISQPFDMGDIFGQTRDTLGRSSTPLPLKPSNLAL